MKYKMLGEVAHKALANITKEKLSPMRTAFYNVCKEKAVYDKNMRKAVQEQVKEWKIFWHEPH